jgi:hypothetical protein
MMRQLLLELGRWVVLEECGIARGLVDRGIGGLGIGGLVARGRVPGIGGSEAGGLAGVPGAGARGGRGLGTGSREG